MATPVPRSKQSGLTLRRVLFSWLGTADPCCACRQLRENLDALNTPIFSHVIHDLQEVFVKYRDPSRTFVKVLDDGDAGN
jgi:hypothetical protein